MKPVFFLLFAFSAIFSTTSHGEETAWQTISSSDGKISVQAPGEAEDRQMVKRTLAGKITTYIKHFETKRIAIDLSFTPVSPKVIKFAGKEGIYKNTKGKVLQEAMGKETSFEDYIVSEVTCKLLRYHMTHPTDKNHQGYEGLTLMLVRDDGLYIANGIVLTEDGMEDVLRFRDSIVIKP